MPDVATWTTQIPEALEVIASQDKDLWFAVDLEALLGVKRRRAQEIISVAGPEAVGRAQAVTRENLVRYLRSCGGSELEAMERRRRREFAQKLKGIEQEVAKMPHRGEIITVSKAPVKRAAVYGLDLLEGVVLEPGRIVLTFQNATEALERLFTLSQAIARDGVDAFEDRVKTTERKAG